MGIGEQLRSHLDAEPCSVWDDIAGTERGAILGPIGLECNSDQSELRIESFFGQQLACGAVHLEAELLLRQTVLQPLHLNIWFKNADQETVQTLLRELELRFGR